MKNSQLHCDLFPLNRPLIGRMPGEGVSPCKGGVLPGGGGVLAARGGVSLPGGLPARGVLLARGVSLPWGSPCPGGLPAWGVLLARGERGSPCQGVSLPGEGGVLPARRRPCQGVLSAGDPPVDRITDTSKNITLATTSLRPVISNLYPDPQPQLTHHVSIISH